MHAASPTYTPLFLRTAVATLFVLLLPLAATAAQHDGLPPDGHFEASMRWTLQHDEAHANGTGLLRWTQVDDQIVAFSAATEQGSYACHGPNGTARSANGTDAEGSCDASTNPVRVVFNREAQDSRFEATVEGEVRTLASLDVGAAAPSLVPGFIVLLLAALFFLTTLAALWAYVRERRMAHYLVRRLYEETKGRMPADWPENMRQQWIARIFIRGKN